MKLIIIIGHHLSERNSSWLLFKQLIDIINIEEIIIYHPYKFYHTAKSKDNIKYVYFFNPLSYSIVYRIVKYINTHLIYLLSNFFSKRVAKRINNVYGSFEDIKLWIYSDYFSLLVINNLISIKNFKFHFSILDDMLYNKEFKSLNLNIEEKYINLLKKCYSFDVPVPELYEYYLDKKYVRNNTIHAYSYSGKFKDIISPKRYENKEIKIGFMGNIFGIESFNKFCLAIQNYFSKDRVVINLYSNADYLYINRLRMNFPAIDSVCKINSFISPNHAIEVLQQHDYLYLLSSFEEKDIFQCKTSFASKTHNYLASGVPIIVHAPEYSAVYRFFHEKQIGLLLPTDEESEVASYLKRFFSKDEYKHQYEKMCTFSENPNKNNHFDSLLKAITS